VASSIPAGPAQDRIDPESNDMPSTLIDIELEKPVAEIADIYRSANSYLVGDVFAELDAMALKLGCRSLKDFRNYDWHECGDGLPAVRAVREYIERTPAAIFHPGYSLLRLQLWERMLEAARKAGVRWQFSAELG